ncbi:SRPBCC domain-containing protein [Aquimarina sp. 2201CG5-10]|uniref:SRPBCC domain-containing protein n=1 Tax=Aquimarina callyspongiae TaxID=3098150 RepID=UPI002AB3F44C|nr:SRPBCC domain-containing protein [Aquimarina sp. 2201CG5-10]MDY8137542.1 SRPBCC domain-containing protein [Aquimarina sp. 2201CG5-10]
MIAVKNKIFTEIEINASTEQVWSVLTDWNKLKEWSSSFVGISTDNLAKGMHSISYYINPITGKIMNVEHEIVDYEEGSKFGWSGKIIGKVKDHHIFSLEKTNRGTTIFKQEDGFHSKNSLSTIMNFLMRNFMTSSYNKFNKELKERVEFLYSKKSI